MNITLGFGKKQLNLKVDEKNILDVLKPNPIQGDVDQVEEVQRALENPIGTKRLKEMVRPGEKVVIITSDVTRPMPTHVVLPSLLEELNSAGIKDEDIKVVFALGSHRKHTEEEKVMGRRSIPGSNALIPMPQIVFIWGKPPMVLL